MFVGVALFSMFFFVVLKEENLGICRFPRQPLMLWWGSGLVQRSSRCASARLPFAGQFSFLGGGGRLHIHLFSTTCFCFFPTCQVRVVRFYVCCPSLLRSFLPLLPRLRRHPRRPLHQMSLDVNMDLQSAVGSAGPQQRAPDCSGQRRTSTGELWSGLGNAGPHPRSSGADWVTPDLTRGAPERSGQRRTSAARRYVRRCVRNMSEKNVRRYVRRYVKRYVKKECQNICQKICQKRMSEDMSEEMSEDMAEEMSEEMPEEMSEDMSKEMPEDMSDKNVRRYVRRNVRRYVNRNVR